MSFLLIVSDGSKMRAFHPSIMEDRERILVEHLARRLMERTDGLFDKETGGESQESLFPRHVEVAMVVDKAMPIAAQSRDDLSPFIEMARTSGYTGDVCPSCHGFRVKRTGTCVTCEDCGNNAGCG